MTRSTDVAAVLHEVMTRHASAGLLRYLSIAPGCTLNESILLDLLGAEGMHLSHQAVHEILARLHDQKLVCTTRRDVTVVTLLQLGADVADDRLQWEGIARRRPPSPANL